ncbi:MAG: hypothetical protein ABJE10_24480 [bacterium]
MSARIGLYVAADRFACVVMRGQRVVWHAERTRLADEALETTLDGFLKEPSGAPFPRPALFVALGPSLAQAKLLSGLPPIDSSSVVRQLIEQNPSRFFLTTYPTAVVAEPMRRAGGWWAAVADASVVAAAHALCERRRWRFGGARPVAAVLNHALVSATGECVHWSDGVGCIDVTYGERGLVATARVESKAYQSPRLQPALDAALGVDAWRYSAAYGAAEARKSAPLAFQLLREGTVQPHNVTRRIGSVTALLLGAFIMLAVPAMLAARVRRQNEHALIALTKASAGVAKERFAAERVAASLKEVRAFVGGRRLVTPLLASLSTQLPESTAVVSLRLDTLGGTLVTLSPLGTAIVPAVGETPGVDGLQLSAPITREQLGPLELQRIAVRFRFKLARNVGPRRS